MLIPGQLSSVTGLPFYSSIFAPAGTLLLLFKLKTSWKGNLETFVPLTAPIGPSVQILLWMTARVHQKRWGCSFPCLSLVCTPPFASTTNANLTPFPRRGKVKVHLERLISQLICGGHCRVLCSFNTGAILVALRVRNWCACGVSACNELCFFKWSLFTLPSLVLWPHVNVKGAKRTC